jgi:DNA-binding HxlR family transcriptional regulator
MLQRIGDKWTLVVIGILGTQRLRFGELHRAIDGISQRMLVVTLRHLERDGLVVRHVFPSVPPRVEYELTPRGRSLRGALSSIGEWVVEHRKGIEEARREYDRAAEGAEGALDEAALSTLTKS